MKNNPNWKPRNALILAHLLIFWATMLIPHNIAFCGEIHDAADNGDVEKIKLLLKADPSLTTSKNRYGQTALHRAAAKGQTNAAELLLDNRADVNAADDDG